jgi:hypothetical protein
MDPHSQVIWILKLAMNIAPVALYFMVLGLVNSQSRVHVVTLRNDWLAMMMVFLPVLMWPVMFLAGAGWHAGAMLTFLAGLAVLKFSAPPISSGWVLYNCTLATVRTALIETLDRLAIDWQVADDHTLTLTDNRRIELNDFPLLKNVTVKIHADDAASLADRLGRTLSQRLDTVVSQPPLSAAAMLLCGAAMLIIPLSLMVQHIDAFVKVFCDFIAV